MQSNVGTIDRSIRFIVGIFLIVAPFLNLFGIWASAPFAYTTMVVGAILVGTAYMRFCPLYRVLGISTCKV